MMYGLLSEIFGSGSNGGYNSYQNLMDNFGGNTPTSTSEDKGLDALVEYANAQDDPQSQGFGSIFQNIFGNNEPEDKGLDAMVDYAEMEELRNKYREPRPYEEEAMAKLGLLNQPSAPAATPATPAPAAQPQVYSTPSGAPIPGAPAQAQPTNATPSGSYIQGAPAQAQPAMTVKDILEQRRIQEELIRQAQMNQRPQIPQGGNGPINWGY